MTKPPAQQPTGPAADRVVYLHVGAPKTGTTYLQAMLHAHRDQLRTDGCLYPASRLWAHHDEARFLSGAPQFLTEDEESSGIIPAPFLGKGWYLLDVQAHYPIEGEIVEGGQLLALHVPPGKFGKGEDDEDDDD